MWAFTHRIQTVVLYLHEQALFGALHANRTAEGDNQLDHFFASQRPTLHITVIQSSRRCKQREKNMTHKHTSQASDIHACLVTQKLVHKATPRHPNPHHSTHKTIPQTSQVHLVARSIIVLMTLPSDLQICSMVTFLTKINT